MRLDYHYCGPEFASGPFSHVFFVETPDGPDTLTYRTHRMQPSGTRVDSVFAHDPRWGANPLVSTSLVRC